MTAFFLGAFMAWTWAGVTVARIVARQGTGSPGWHYLWAVPGWPYLVERLTSAAAPLLWPPTAITAPTPEGEGTEP